MKTLFGKTLQVILIVLPLFLCTVASAQQVINGKVVDTGGTPVVGAMILEEGTSNGVITSMDGSFKIRAKAGAPILVSLLGFQDERAVLSEGMTIILKEDAELLDEVVVVGFGTQRKATLTGSVASVSGDVLESRPVSNTTIGLQGIIPGLTITRTAARPGNEGMSIQIRGASSINAVEPLIIIDGSPAISTEEFSNLNPNDIENISVLKDASAAIYGSRAAGGVILVTTKKGKRGESLKVTYNGMVTINTPANQIPLAGMKTWATELVKASYQDYVQSDGNGGEVWTQRFLPQWKDVLVAGGKPIHPNFSNGSATTEDYTLADKMAEGVGFEFTDTKGILHFYESNNWLDYLYGPTVSTQHNASVKGSTDRVRYMASIGYTNDRSIISLTYDGIKKYNTRANLEFDLTKWLTWSNNVSYTASFTDSPRDGLDGLNSGMYDTPSAPAYTPDGYFYDFYVAGRSPVAAMLGAGRNKSEFEAFRYNTTLTAKITEDFKIVGTASLTRNNTFNTETKLTYYAGNWKAEQGLVAVNPGTSQYIQERTRRTFYQNYVLQADYSHSFANVHNVSAMLGINAEKNSYKNVTAKRTDLLYEGLYDLNTASSDPANQTITGGSNASGYFSYIGRFNYDYKGKYIFEALGRRDGTSKFHPDYRWANFYSVSAGWRISEENFLKNVDWVDNLKIRASFGKTGGAISSIGNYDYLATMSTTGTYFFEGGKTGTAVLGAMTDYSRTWEVLQNFNVGLDFSFLHNRLTGSFDWYQKRNNNMLTDITYPAVLGATAPKTNSAKMRVRGWEAQIGWQDKKGDFSYWVSATLADNHSLVTDFSGTDVWQAGRVAVRKGYPLNSLFVYKTDGYFSSYEEIEAYYAQYAAATSALSGVAKTSSNTHLRPGDIKKILILDPAHDKTEGKGNTGGAGDVYFYGDTNPHYTFGLNLGFQFKGFDFSTFIQGVGSLILIRGGWGDNSGMNMCAFYRNYNNILTTHLDTWSWDNQDAEYPRLSLQNNKNNWNMNNNDSSIQNGWYARVKNLTIGYTLPEKWMRKADISRLRVYFSGDNIAEITGIKDGYDPEKSTASRTSLPFARNWTFGLDITF